MPRLNVLYALDPTRKSSNVNSQSVFPSGQAVPTILSAVASKKIWLSAAMSAFRDSAILGGVLFNFRERRIRIRFVARFVPQLLEDVAMLRLDHRLGDREVVALRKLVEQLPLHVRTGEVVEFLALLVAD